MNSGRSSASGASSRDWMAIALLLILTIAFFSRLVLGNLVMAGLDVFTYFYPYKAYAAETILSGSLPLWNPYLFMGVPFLANIQSAVLYPLNLPLCWLPVPHIDPIPRILAVERSGPEEHEELKFRLREANQKGDFKAPDRVLPLKYVPLRSNEELLVRKAKRRRGIILARGMDIYENITPILRQKAKKHLQEDALFVIPLYGIQQEALVVSNYCFP